MAASLSEPVPPLTYPLPYRGGKEIDVLLPLPLRGRGRGEGPSTFEHPDPVRPGHDHLVGDAEKQPVLDHTDDGAELLAQALGIVEEAEGAILMR
jgi:hypothetical protein